MVRSKATTVAQYLGEVDGERREIISEVRAVILANLPAGYVETMNWGMISYEVPLEVFPNTYNKRPLMYCGLAAQKNHCALHLMNVYADKQLEALLAGGFQKAGKKLDMGKSCVRFKTASDLPLETIATVVAATGVEDFIAMYKASRSGG